MYNEPCPSIYINKWCSYGSMYSTPAVKNIFLARHMNEIIVTKHVIINAGLIIP